MLQKFSNRFWSKVDMKDDCWNWTGSLSKQGYGRFGINGRVNLAHRVAWTLYKGEIPKGMNVLHKCDNCSCVNPRHLFLGTQKDNIQDMFSKGRDNRAKGEKVTLAVLTEEKVKKIRFLYRDGFKPHVLKMLFGIADTTFWNVITKRTWKHI